MYFVENSLIWILILLVCSFLSSDVYSSGWYSKFFSCLVKMQISSEKLSSTETHLFQRDVEMLKTIVFTFPYIALRQQFNKDLGMRYRKLPLISLHPYTHL